MKKATRAGTPANKGKTTSPAAALLEMPWLLCALAVLAAGALYARTAGFAFVELDDNFYVTLNPLVRQGVSLEGLCWAFASTNKVAYWHPLTWLSLMLDASLYGDWAGGYHLTNALLHCLNVGLFFWLALRFTADRFVAFAAALLFALHPMHQESVAWVTERKDVLFLAFGLGALHAHVSLARQGGWRSRAALYACFALSLMSKPTLVVLPGILLLLDLWPLGRLAPDFWRRGGLSQAWPLLAEKLPLAALSAASTLVTFWTHPASLDQNDPGLWLRLGDALVAYALYAWKFFVPLGLGVFYPFPEHLPVWQVAGALAALLAALMLALAWAGKRPWLLVALGWLLLGLLPTIMPPKYGLHVAYADRMAYFAYLGPYLALPFGLLELSRRVAGAEAKARAVAWWALCALALWFGGLSHLNLEHWRDTPALFDQTLAVTERNYIIESNYGSYLLQRGSAGRAEQHLLRALELAPRHFSTLNNLANLYVSTGRYDLAAQMYERAIAEDPQYMGRLGDYHYSYGLCLAQLGRLEEAEAHYKEALAVNPEDAEAYNDLGNIALARADLKTAEERYAKALALRPGYPVAQANLARVRARLAGAKP